MRPRVVAHDEELRDAFHRPAPGRVVAGTVAASAVLALLRLPSPVLFGSLLAGMVHALTSSAERELQMGPVLSPIVALARELGADDRW